MQKENWPIIARLLDLTKESSESNFQNGIMSILTSDLGWPESQVSKEYPVRMGSTSKKMDFLLKDSEQHPMVVIEVKLSKSHDDGVAQLGSYMNALEPQLNIGLVIKDKIYVFYDESNGRKLSSLSDAIYSIPFESGCAEGEKFVELFDFNSFSYKKLLDFCVKRKQELKEKQDKLQMIQKIVNLLLGSSGVDFVKSAVVEKLESIEPFKNYSFQVLEAAIADLDISILKNTEKQELNKSEYTLKESTTNYNSVDLDINWNLCGIDEAGKIPKIYTDGSREIFVKKFHEQGYGFIYWELENRKTIKHRWENRNKSITTANINGNLTSRDFYKKNKQLISKIIISSKELKSYNQLLI
ncbi:type I restriction enzyme HsdR N-terminal domain-containing protein [uncultured Duncaniella sp.]|uniref:type I restriction enzyme HsdR N-terminal domain-containing protein n=2 Tax=uncultured Duncaniella sp. TaxID=2768039 RepID=UPI0025D952A9|nr:type I restriction enzyme HsdR N-terminal domain-containing protein [uncultured Duncaniella sp.]